MQEVKWKRVPSLVVHTPVPKQVEENPGLLDEMWACLLNDYLDNLGDIDDDETFASSSDAASISTAVLRAERRRLKKLKKQEQARNRLKGTTIEKLRESAVVLAEERSRASDQDLFQHLETSSYKKGILLDAASKSMDSKTRKSTESRDKYEPSHRHRVTTRSEETLTVSRPSLDPEADPLPVQTWSDMKTKTSSIDADGLVARNEWMQIKETTESIDVKSKNDPIGMEAPRSKPRTKARVDSHGVIHLEEEESITRTNTSDDKKWHMEHLTSAQRSNKHDQMRKSLTGSDRERSWHQKLEPKESKAQDLIAALSQHNGLTSRIDPFRATSRLNLQIDSSEVNITTLPTHEGYGPRIDTRDADDNVWSLEEDKRTELELIRRKKLDREEALVRIRAIKARIAKLEI